MDLSWQTRLLLWLLSKRKDINTIQIHPITPMDLLQDLEQFTNDELHPDDELIFDRDHLEDCYQMPSKRMDGAEN